MAHQRDNLPSWATFVVYSSRYCASNYLTILFIRGKELPSSTPIECNAPGRPSLNDLVHTTRDLQHVSQPAASAAWLGVMLAQYWPGISTSTVTYLVDTRVIPPRLRVNTSTQEGCYSGANNTIRAREVASGHKSRKGCCQPHWSRIGYSQRWSTTR